MYHITDVANIYLIFYVAYLSESSHNIGWGKSSAAEDIDGKGDWKREDRGKKAEKDGGTN